ncbi:MAG: helicase-related protein [Thaumarchaeota archaeon]|nr:helicase-related protein [Nitrososphaerota archaeon]
MVSSQVFPVEDASSLTEAGLDTALQYREYQTDIASEAAKSNTLVILPTGLGKTIIAILVAKERLNGPDNWLKNRRVLVLAPTKPLVLQHRESFFRAFNSVPPFYQVSEFVVLTGESSHEQRLRFWEGNGGTFLFATPETVANDLELAGEKSILEDFVLIVFDEAHRAVKEYAYTEIARRYVGAKPSDPLILGLTASPGSSREKIEEIKGNLFIQKVASRNEEDADVSPYVEETTTEAIRVRLSDEYEGSLISPLKVVFEEKIGKLRKLGLVPRAGNLVSKKILIGARETILARMKKQRSRMYLFNALFVQAQAVMILHAIEVAETQGAYTLTRYFERMRENPDQGRATKSLLKDERWMRVEASTKKAVRSDLFPKFELLSTLVSEQLERKSTSKIIIFSQYRDTIEEIVGKLLLVSPTIRPHKFVGQSSKGEQDKGMSQKIQGEILERFRTGTEFNVLVSSSIGEEGLHIPDVDLVVFYEAVPSEIRSIQRKGRTGRTMPGRVVILLAEGTVDEAYYFSTLAKEKKMKSLVVKASEV